MSLRDGSALPSGWEMARLSDIAQINPSLDRDIVSDEVSVNFIPMRAVEPEGMGIVRPEVRTYGEVKRGYTAFLPGDVIMAKITPCMENGKICVVPHLGGTVCFGSTEFHVLRAEAGIEPRWIAYFLLRHSTRNEARRQMMGGVGQMRVPSGFLDSLNVPVPPHAEQIRALDEVDELLSDLDAGETALVQARGKLDRYRASVLNAAVTGALTSEKGKVRQVRLAELITAIGQGWSPRCDLMRPPLPEEWAIIKTTAVQSMRYADSEAKPLPPGLNPRVGLEIKVGDMLMTRKGPRQRAGVACLVRATRPRLMICDTVYRFRCRVDLVEPGYLELALNSPAVVAEIDKQKSGINDSGVSLTHKKLGDVLVPLPPRESQSAIVQLVEEQESVIERLEREIDMGVERARALRQSILNHAFAGHIVAQDRGDEPAGGLLRRISCDRAERANHAKSAKPVGRRTKVARRRASST